MLEGVSRHGDDVCDASCSVFYISCSVFVFLPMVMMAVVGCLV